MLQVIFKAILLLLSLKSGSNTSPPTIVEDCYEYTTTVANQSIPFGGKKSIVQWYNGYHLFLFSNTTGAGFLGKCTDITCTNPVFIAIIQNQYCPTNNYGIDICEGAIAVDNEGNAAITYYSNTQEQIMLQICPKSDLEANICNTIPPILIESNSTQGYAHSLAVRDDLVTISYAKNTGDIKYVNCYLSNNCSNTFNVTINDTSPSTVLALFLLAPNLTHTYTIYLANNNLHLLLLPNINGTAYQNNIIDTTRYADLHMILVNHQLLIAYTESIEDFCWRVATCHHSNCSSHTLSTQASNCGFNSNYVTLSKAQGGFNIYYGAFSSYRVICRDSDLTCTKPIENELDSTTSYLFSTTFKNGSRNVLYFKEDTTSVVLKGCLANQ